MFPLSHAIGKPIIDLADVTIGQQLRTLSQQNNLDQVALIFDHQQVTITFNQLVHDAIKLSNGLHRKLGLSHGDHVAIWSANCYDYVVALFGCAAAGVVTWLFDPSWTSHDLKQAIFRTQFKAVFVPGSDSEQICVINKFAEVFNDVFGAKKFHICGASYEELVPDLDDFTLVALDGNHLDSYQFGRTTLITQLMQNCCATSTQFDDKSQPQDACLVLLTSGSTGIPKAVMLSHFSLINDAMVMHNRITQQKGECALHDRFIHVTHVHRIAQE